MCNSGLLEWEFSLPTNLMISHGWYHGTLSRTAAENLLQQDREFLVRDSSSQPENYVLSCRSNGQHLHFVIQRIILHAETVYERDQYQFEDEAYDTISDLITSYVGSGKPISAASGARIQYPANRARPLTNFAMTGDRNYSVISPLAGSAVYGSPQSLYTNFIAKPEFQIWVPFNKQRSRSLTTGIGQYDNVGKNASADGSLQRQIYRYSKCFSSESNSGSNNWVAGLPTSPPEKPTRYENSKGDDQRLDLQRLCDICGSDSGNGSGDSTQGSIHSNPNKSKTDLDFIVTATINQQCVYDFTEARLLQTESLEYCVKSRINREMFQSNIIPSGPSKPLESKTLHTIKLLLHTSGPRILANHMAKIDFHFLLDNAPQVEGLDNTASGLELCFLPQGRLLRLNFIERIETFRFLIAVSILTCQTARQRADVINDWILLAVETKTALGNLYGFSAIMFGLCMMEIRTRKLWK